VHTQKYECSVKKVLIFKSLNIPILEYFFFNRYKENILSEIAADLVLNINGEVSSEDPQLSWQKNDLGSSNKAVSPLQQFLNTDISLLENNSR